MRLVTRADLDGVASAVLLTTVENVEQVVFANPKDIEDRTIEVKPGDAIANLPFHPNAGMWFDHHEKAEEQPIGMAKVKGKWGASLSSARLIFEYFDSPLLTKYEDMLRETDRIDSANLSIEDVLDPKGWVLLSFTLDPYMGLAAFHSYANIIISAIKSGSTIARILEIPEVKGRVGRFLLDADDFKEELKNATRLDGNVIVTDAREVDIMPTGNRFLAFALFPEGNVQLVLTKDHAKDQVRVRIGKSIFRHTCRIHLGHLAAEYGGGGLSGAAGFNLDTKDAEQKIADIIWRLKS